MANKGPNPATTPNVPSPDPSHVKREEENAMAKRVRPGFIFTDEVGEVRVVLAVHEFNVQSIGAKGTLATYTLDDVVDIATRSHEPDAEFDPFEAFADAIAAAFHRHPLTRNFAEAVPASRENDLICVLKHLNLASRPLIDMDKDLEDASEELYAGGVKLSNFDYIAISQAAEAIAEASRKVGALLETTLAATIVNG